MESNDLILAGSVTQADEQVFKKLFSDWYGPLCAYAASVLKDDVPAAEAVQAVFCRLWEKRAGVSIRDSLKAYLFGSVHHECVSWIRKEKTRQTHRAAILSQLGAAGGGAQDKASDKVELGELEQRFLAAVDLLPPHCRTVFQLSRFGELTYREIAMELGLSVKTIEAQMSKALRLLRQQLADYLG